MLKNKIGEIKYNNFGSKMKIIEFIDKKHIKVYFNDYNWTSNYTSYFVFTNEKLSCPYEPRTFGIGYIGEGKYNPMIYTSIYNTWRRMFDRCYNKKNKHNSYNNCKVCEKWHNFQNFAKWYEDNYYEVENEKMHLDKDILVKGNKVYSPETCIFVPQRINVLFVKQQNHRGKYPMGVYYDKRRCTYHSHVRILNDKKKRIYLGTFDNANEAFNSYKNFKEKYIKEVADEYKNKIPKKLYDAMYKYKIEITD